jgi:opacity protein-like surface antigen
MMKKTLFTALAAATALAAVGGAATAQPYGYDRDGRYDGRHYDRDDRREDRWERNHINQRQNRIERRIDVGVDRGALTPREAGRLQQEARDIARLEARYRYNGLTGWERSDLDRRLDRLEARLAYELRDREYGYGYGYRR